MSRPSRAEMRALAAAAERGAARSQAAATDPANSPTIQAQAKAAAGFARRHAQEYREDAARLREGYLPGEDW